MRTLGLSLLVAVLAVACTNDRRGGGGIRQPKNKDASTSMSDGGNLPPGCEDNPNGCVEHQLLAGDCSCIAACETGYAWNGTACDLIETPDSGSELDSGVPPGQDTGVDTGVVDTGTNDTGVVDTGTPDTGVPACTANPDCPGPSPVCLNPNTLDFCNGSAGCVCAQSCDPYSSTNTCTQQVCTWLGPSTTALLGLCLNDQGGGTQGQSCNTQYDAQGNVTSDSCNRTRNSICWGASPASPVGVCTTICGTSNTAFCPSLGNYTCDDLGTPANGYGVCLQPPPNFTDIGNSCTTPSTCQGNLCSQTLAGSCSAMCSGLANCPANSYCLNLPQEGLSCAEGCTHNGTTGDDAFCQGRNANTVCENLGSTTPIGVCIPACMDSTQCGTGMTCTNGHCQ